MIHIIQNKIFDSSWGSPACLLQTWKMPSVLKYSKYLATKLYQVSAWICERRALQQAKYRQHQPRGGPGLHVDPPAHHLPTFISSPYSSTGFQSTHAAACLREVLWKKNRGLQLTLWGFSLISFQKHLVFSGNFLKSSTQWTDSKLKFWVEWLKSIKTQCNGRQNGFRGKILHRLL